MLGQLPGRTEILGVVNPCGARFVERYEAVIMLFASIVKVFVATPFITRFAARAKSIVRLPTDVVACVEAEP
jgi:hypothetical protein